ncbi:hypothetical protein FJ656_25955 [Schumannella luteola]|uniref:Uncharacterized protein n=1 Tax=Schumannella luteola TaxID=472059 RepID=A0A852Y8B6_9MICO|nr:hypothetical protein [Schumannella luteola]NYG98112.1 hypothetical protein [Schumannella luteola]TPX01835.1 hypothetical protein FJ656_25955 [Schumannella luteola]
MDFADILPDLLPRLALAVGIVVLVGIVTPLALGRATGLRLSRLVVFTAISLLAAVVVGSVIVFAQLPVQLVADALDVDADQALPTTLLIALVTGGGTGLLAAIVATAGAGAGGAVAGRFTRRAAPRAIGVAAGTIGALAIVGAVAIGPVGLSSWVPAAIAAAVVVGLLLAVSSALPWPGGFVRPQATPHAASASSERAVVALGFSDRER